MALSKQYRGAADVCASKRRYGSKEMAERVAAAASRNVGKTISAYLCTACKRWHLTSRPVR